MYTRLHTDVELQNEIVFFMHNCLEAGETKDLSSSKAMPCAEVICKRLAASSYPLQLQKGQYTSEASVVYRCLLALEVVTRKDRG